MFTDSWNSPCVKQRREADQNRLLPSSVIWAKAQEALAILNGTGDQGGAASTRRSLAQISIDEGRPADAEAQKEVEDATKLAAKNQYEEVRLKLAIVTASVRAASGKSPDQAAATKSLEATLAEATKFGFVPYQYEARLALGELELKSGHTAAGRARLAALEKDAQAKGFGLIARQAAAAVASAK